MFDGMELIEKQSMLTKVSEVTCDHDGIIEISFLEKDIKVSVEDIEEIFEARKTLSPGPEKHLLIVDIRTAPDTSHEAKELSKSDKYNEATQALAIIVGNQISRLIGNFYMSFNRAYYPMRMFNAIDEARSWLLTQR